MDVLAATHERRNFWARQLRPRLAGKPVRWVETRSRAALSRVLAGVGCGLVVFDLGAGTVETYEELATTAALAPEALVLAVNADARALDAARELGATLALPAATTPPEVAALLARWVDVALRRNARAGWLERERPPEHDDWWQALIEGRA